MSFFFNISISTALAATCGHKLRNDLQGVSGDKLATDVLPPGLFVTPRLHCFLDFRLHSTSSARLREKVQVRDASHSPDRSRRRTYRKEFALLFCVHVSIWHWAASRYWSHWSLPALHVPRVSQIESARRIMKEKHILEASVMLNRRGV